MAAGWNMGRMRLHQAPEFVAAPGVERPVIPCFTAGVAQNVVFDAMSAPRAVADADRRARHPEDLVVGSRDSFGTRYIHASDLLTKDAAIVNEIVGRITLVRKMALRADSRVQRTDEADRAVARLGDSAAGDGIISVVPVHEDGVAPDG